MTGEKFRQPRLLTIKSLISQFVCQEGGDGMGGYYSQLQVSLYYGVT